MPIASNAEGTVRAAEAARTLRGGWHPVQVQAMTILSERVASPTEIAVELGLTKAKSGYVSNHIRRLVDSGLVVLVRTIRVRGAAEHFYRAVTPFVVMGEEAAQLSLDERLVLSSWTISCINRDFLRAVESGSIDERTDRHLSRYPLLLDDQGITDLFTEHNRVYYRTGAITEESAARLSGRIGQSVSAIVASFPMPTKEPGRAWGPVNILGNNHLSNCESGDAVKATARILRSGWHPIQIQALTILSERVASPKEIAIDLGLTKAKAGLVSYHIRELLKRGQVELVRTVAVRGANEHFYRAAEPFIAMGEDAERMTMDERLVLSCWTISCMNRDFLRAVESGSIDERTDRHLSRCPLLLDEQGIEDLFAEHNRVFYRTREIQTESRKRQVSTGVTPRPTAAILASFLMPGNVHGSFDQSAGTTSKSEDCT